MYVKLSVISYMSPASTSIYPASPRSAHECTAHADVRVGRGGGWAVKVGGASAPRPGASAPPPLPDVSRRLQSWWLQDLHTCERRNDGEHVWFFLLFTFSSYSMGFGCLRLKASYQALRLGPLSVRAQEHEGCRHVVCATQPQTCVGEILTRLVTCPSHRNGQIVRLACVGGTLFAGGGGAHI